MTLPPPIDHALLDHVRRRCREEPNTGCWLWAGSLARTGYANVLCWPKRLGGDGKPRNAYVLSYLAIKGPVPEGVELDHLCKDRRCCNGWHLEAVTREVNNRRNRIGEPHPLTAWQMAAADRC